MWKVAFVTIAAWLLAACADKPVTPANVSPSAKTVGVVIAIQPQIRVATTGMTVFENALDVVDVADWQLDDVAFAAASAALSPHYQVSRVVPKGNIIDTDTFLAAFFTDQPSIERQANKFVDADSPVDLYVVISRSVSGSPCGQLANIYCGIGFSKQRLILGTLDPVIHTYLTVTVLDGKTLKVIAREPLRNPHPHRGLEGAAERIEGFPWKDYWHELTDEQQDLVRDRLKTLLRDSVTTTVGALLASP